MILFSFDSDALPKFNHQSGRKLTHSSIIRLNYQQSLVPIREHSLKAFPMELVRLKTASKFLHAAGSCKQDKTPDSGTIFHLKMLWNLTAHLPAIKKPFPFPSSCEKNVQFHWQHEFLYLCSQITSPDGLVSLTQVYNYSEIIGQWLAPMVSILKFNKVFVIFILAFNSFQTCLVSKLFPILMHNETYLIFLKNVKRIRVNEWPWPLALINLHVLVFVQ